MRLDDTQPPRNQPFSARRRLSVLAAAPLPIRDGMTVPVSKAGRCE
jgi:hypothetical protein